MRLEVHNQFQKIKSFLSGFGFLLQICERFFMLKDWNKVFSSNVDFGTRSCTEDSIHIFSRVRSILMRGDCNAGSRDAH